MSFGILDSFKDMEKADALVHGITVGEVIDTNDPQQMGRVRAICPALGDTKHQERRHIPWAMYGSPFAGVNELTSRGREDDTSSGPVAYGMWAIPKVGSFVLIMCIDGDPNHRVWVGCLPPQFFPHTMPHGRYSEELQDGPITSTEQPLQPLHKNMTEAFGEDRTAPEFRTRAADNQVAYVSNEEIGAGRVTSSQQADDRTQGYTRSRIQPDLEFPSTEGVNWDSQIYSITTPGFHSMHMDDRAESCRMRFRTTGGNQIILDDTNERIYVSTPTGKTWVQIDEKGTIDIFAEQDISIHSEADINMTAQGAIRMDGKKGIHMVTDKEFRVHAQEDINFRTEQFYRSYSTQETRIESLEDMHIWSRALMYVRSTNQMHIETESSLFVESAADTNILANDFMRIESIAPMDIKTSNVLRVQSTLQMDIKSDDALRMESAQAMDIKAQTNLNVQAVGSTLHIKSGSDMNIDAGGNMDQISGGVWNQQSSGNMNLLGAQIHLNDGGGASGNSGALSPNNAVSANPATLALEAEEKQAFLVTRLPQHEPWPRVYFDDQTDAATAQDIANSQVLEYPNGAEENIDRVTNITTTIREPKDFTRNDNWRR